MDGFTLLTFLKEAFLWTISYIILVVKLLFGFIILLLGILLLLYTTTGELVFGGHMSASYISNISLDLTEIMLTCVPFSSYLFGLLNLKPAVYSFQTFDILSELAKALLMFLSTTASIEIAKVSYKIMKNEARKTYIWMEWLGNFLFNCLILPTIVVFTTFFHEIFTRTWAGLFGIHTSSSITMIVFFALILLLIGWLLHKKARKSFIHLLTDTLITFTMCLCVIIGFCFLATLITNFSYYESNTAELWGVLFPFLAAAAGFSILLFIKTKK